MLIKYLKLNEKLFSSGDLNIAMKSIELLVEKSKNDIIILDALYQWADNPTAMTAIKRYGYTPNHNLIKSNIEVRYNLEPKEIDEIFKKLNKQ